MGILGLAALTALTIAPTVQFSSDSKYTSNKILDVAVQENYDETETLISKDLLFTENYVVGYMIYDNPETSYIDGLKVDNQFVTDWKFENYDDTVAHTILIKTVYTDDVAGAFAAASHGDFSKLLSNPIMILQTVYFTLAIVMVLISTLATLKRNLNAKHLEEKYAKKAMETVQGIVSPLCSALQGQNKDILKAILLAQSKDSHATLDIIDLVTKNTAEDLNAVADKIKESVIKSAELKEQLHEQATKTINSIAEGSHAVAEATMSAVNTIKETIKDDGTSI